MTDSPFARELRIVVADPLETTLRGTRVSLEEHGFCVAGQATTAADAVETALRERPDVCLLDGELPGGALDAVARLAAELPDMPIVVLAHSDDAEALLAAFAAGADGYLLKDVDAERLAHALRGAVAGDAALSRSLAGLLVEDFRGRKRAREAPVLRDRGIELTDREYEVLAMLRGGLDTNVMAGRLGISPVTVRRHVSELLRKLGVPDREAAARLLDDDGEAA